MTTREHQLLKENEELKKRLAEAENATLILKEEIKRRVETSDKTEALMQGREILEEAQQLANLGTWEFDLSSKKMKWSENLYRIFHQDPDKFHPDFDNLIRLMHPDDRKRINKTISGAIKTGKGFTSEYRIILENGDIRIIQPRARFKMNASGRPVKMIGTTQDITEMKKMEESLRKSEERLKYHFENSPLAVVEWDADFIVTHWSVEAERIFGWKKEECLNKKIDSLNIIYAEDIPIVERTMERLSGGQVNTVVVSNRNVTKAGEIIMCKWYNSVLFDQNGKMSSVMSLVDDITIRNKVEESLRLSEERYRALAENVPDVIVRFDNNLKLIYANRAAKERIGKPGYELIGRSLLEYGGAPSSIAIWENAAREVMAEVRPKRIEFTNLWQEEERIYDVYIMPELDASRKVGSVVAFARDITEYKQSEEALRQSEERFRLVLKNSPVTIAAQDLDLKFIWNYNQRSIKSSKEVIGKTDWDLFPEQAERLVSLKRKVIETGRELKEKMWITRPGGKMYLDLYFEPLQDKNGKMTGVGIATVDLTDLRKSEEALQKSERHYRLLFETMMQGTVYQDKNGNIISANPMAQQILGLNQEELKRSSSIKLEFQTIREDGSLFPGLEHPAMVSLQTGKKVQNIVMGVYNPREQRYRWIRVDAVPMFNEGEEKPYMVYTLFNDITEQKRAEDEIRTSEANLRGIMEATQESIWMFSNEGKILLANTIALNRIGKPSGEIIGKNMDEVVSPELASLRMNFLNRVVKSASPMEFEDERAKMHFRHSFYPVKDSLDRVTAVVSFSRDITERKHAEEILQTSLQRFYMILSNMQNGILLVTADNRIEFANQSFCNIFRLKETPEALLNLSADELMRKIRKAYSDPEREMTRIREIVRLAQPVKGESISMFKDQTFLRDFIPIRIGEKILGRLWNHVDVTKLKIVEEEIREKEKENAFLARILNLSSQAFGIGMLDGNIGLVNKAFEALTGYTGNELKALKWNTILTPREYLQMEEQLLNELVFTGKPVRYEKEYLRKDGTRIPVELLTHVMKDPEGHPEYFFAFISDITERKKYENNLHQLIRTLRAMQSSSLLMVNAIDEQKFLRDVCQVIIEDCGHKMVWIGYKENDPGKHVRPVAFAGFEEEYLEKLKITWDDSERGKGPSGMAIRTGKPSLCRNMQTDPAFKPWRKEAVKRGYASSIVLPLLLDEDVFGIMNIYSEEPDGFTEDEQRLLEKLAVDLAYGIKSIRLNIALKQAKEDLEEKVEQRTAMLQRTLKDLDSEKQRFQDVINLIPAYVALINSDHKITFTNKVFHEHFGRINNRDCFNLFFGRDDECENCKAKKVYSSDNPFHWEAVCQNERIYQISDFPFTDSDGTMLILEIGVDMTEKKNMEKYVLNKILETEEKDRKRFASDLHDDLGPTLSAIKLQLSLMGTVDSDAKRAELLNTCDQLLLEGIDKMRTVANNIMPNLIESYGLETSIKSFLHKMEKNRDIKFNLQSNLSGHRFDAETELHLYRVITELVNNTLKHSGANAVNIDMRLSERNLKISYADNGIGYSIDPNVTQTSGIGIQNMMYRMELLNGTIDFSTKGGQTYVRITKPL